MPWIELVLDLLRSFLTELTSSNRCRMETHLSIKHPLVVMILSHNYLLAMEQVYSLEMMSVVLLLSFLIGCWWLVDVLIIQDGSTPLHRAATWDQLSITKYLCERGADIHKPNKVTLILFDVFILLDWYEICQVGDTPLHCAAYAGSQSVCVWLLVQGSLLNTPNNVREDSPQFQWILTLIVVSRLDKHQLIELARLN